MLNRLVCSYYISYLLGFCFRCDAVYTIFLLPVQTKCTISPSLRAKTKSLHIIFICLPSSFAFQPLFPQFTHLNLHITPCFIILCICRYNSLPVYFPHILHTNHSSGNQQLLILKKPLSFRGKTSSSKKKPLSFYNYLP